MREHITGTCVAAIMLLAGGAQGGLGDDGQTTLVLADSVDDYAGDQGENGWFYGYYDGDAGADSFQPGDFELMNIYDEGAERWWADGTDEGPITLIDAEFMHPNAYLSDLRDPSEQWAVRRWISGMDASEVNISVDLSRANPEFAGDGVVLRVFIDGLETLAVELFANNDAGLSFDLTTAVSEGTVIDFAIDPIGDALFDAVRIGAEITTVVPTPGVLAGFGLAGLLAGRRRR